MADDDWHILDSRNGNRSGPYSKGDALAQAELLNRHVLRNDSPLLAALCAGGTVTGPFYARAGGVGRR